jgi:hypothetical protein
MIAQLKKQTSSINDSTHAWRDNVLILNPELSISFLTRLTYSLSNCAFRSLASVTVHVSSIFIRSHHYHCAYFSYLYFSMV